MSGSRQSGTGSSGSGRRQVARPDPRLRQRRVTVVREQGKRRLRILALLSVLPAVVGLGWLIARSPMADLDHLRVVGAVKVTDADLRQAAGLHQTRALVDISPARAARAIEALPWVASVRVTREWPGTIKVAISERHAVAGVAEPGGTWMIVDGTGRVLERTDSAPLGVPHVHDAKTSTAEGTQINERARLAVVAAAALPESLRAVVGGLNIRPDGLELALTMGGVVRLGDPADQLAEKLRAAATVLARVEGGVAVLDVRVPRAPVLARA